ncbi:MAG: hypothetical protein ABR509_05570 [Candidatus Limnocylindria bacterium]
MRVELLYWDGDPHYMAARQNLVEVLNEDAFETTIQMIAVNSDDDAEYLEFVGSPTIRIDGEDVLSAIGRYEGHEDGFGLRRRDYPADDGQGRAPVPGKGLIRRAIESARGWAHG